MTIKIIFFFYTLVTVFYKVFIIKLGMALAIFKLFSQSQVSNTIEFSNHCVQHFFHLWYRNIVRHNSTDSLEALLPGNMVDPPDRTMFW